MQPNSLTSSILASTWNLTFRATPSTLESVLTEARTKQDELLALLASLAPELGGQRYHRHSRSYSGGAEEFIEAATFLHYLATGRVPTFAEMADTFLKGTGYPLQPTDYLTGIGDLTGELMRLCLNAAARSDTETATKACDAVRTIARVFPLAEHASGNYGVRKKVDEMTNSVKKCELACFALRLRSLEKVPGRIFGLDDEEGGEENADTEQGPRPSSAPRGRGGGRGGGRGRGGRGGGSAPAARESSGPTPMEDVESP